MSFYFDVCADKSSDFVVWIAIFCVDDFEGSVSDGIVDILGVQDLGKFLRIDCRISWNLKLCRNEAKFHYTYQENKNDFLHESGRR